MIKIGFFGGSFNPPTIAHFKIVQKSIKEFGLDKIVIIPMGDKYEKSELISFKYRYEMLKQTFKEIPKVEISKMQDNQVKRSYAIDSLRKIDAIYSNSKNYFIMGLYNYCKIKDWKDSDELLNQYEYIVFKRDNIKIPYFSNKAHFIDVSIDISSKQVRNMIQNNSNLENVLNKEVIEFIKKNNLYKE